MDEEVLKLSDSLPLLVEVDLQLLDLGLILLTLPSQLQGHVAPHRMQLAQVIPFPILFLLETPLKILDLLIEERSFLVELRLRLHLGPRDLLHPLLHLFLDLSHLITAAVGSLPEFPHLPVPLGRLSLPCRFHLLELFAHDHVRRLDLGLLETQLLVPVVALLNRPSQFLSQIPQLSLKAVLVVALQRPLQGQLPREVRTHLVDQVEKEVRLVER